VTEKSLIDKCKKQDPLAQKELYETYYIEMKRLVMRYLRDEDDAFDALSKGFYAALSKMNQFTYQGEGSLAAWIRRIMVNEALTKIRASKRDLFLLSEEAIVEEAGSYEEADVSFLYSCIQSLPDGARAVFNLVAVEGYSHKEAAKLLDINESTSRSQLVYARNKVKELIKGSTL